MFKTGFTLLALGLLGNALASWRLDIKGEAYTNDPYSGPTLIWKKQNYEGYTQGDFENDYDDYNLPAATEGYDPQSGMSGLNISTIVYGTHGRVWGQIYVRRKWVPGGTKNEQNYKIRSVVEGVVNPDETLDATNGFKQESGSNSAYLLSKKLIQPGLADVTETAVPFSVTPDYDLLNECYIFIGAAFDNRYARVGASAIPAAYQVKSDVETFDISVLHDELWDNNAIARVQGYYYQLPKAADPVVAQGAKRKELRRVGLPEGYYYRGEVISRFLSNTFTGIASSFGEAGESYNFQDDLSGTTVSDTYSGSGPFDIESIGPIRAKGGYILREDTSLSRHDKEDSSETVKLDYTWADGYEAQAELTMLFMDRYSNQRRIQIETIHEGPALTPSFVLPDGVTTRAYSPWGGGTSRKVRWDNSLIAYKATGAIVGVAAIFLGPVSETAAATASLLGVAMSFGTPAVGETDLTPDSPFTPDTQLVKHRLIIQSPDLAEDLEGETNEEKMRILAPRMEWKFEYIPELAVDVYLCDHYGVQGYAGHALRQRKKQLEDPTASQAKRYTYVAS